MSGKFDDGNFIFSLQVTCLVFCPITNMYWRHIHAPTTTLSPRGVAASGAHTETIAQHPSLFFQQPLLAASAGRQTKTHRQTHRATAPNVREVPPGRPRTEQRARWHP